METQQNEIDVKTCRVCLQPGDSHISTWSYGNLRLGYKRLTGLTIEVDDDMPPHLCTECSQRLLNFLKFRDRCIETHMLLMEVLREYDSVTQTTIEATLGGKNKNTTHLQVRHNAPDHYDLELIHIDRSTHGEVDNIESETIADEDDNLSVASGVVHDVKSGIIGGLLVLEDGIKVEKEKPSTAAPRLNNASRQFYDIITIEDDDDADDEMDQSSDDEISGEYLLELFEGIRGEQEYTNREMSDEDSIYKTPSNTSEDYSSNQNQKSDPMMDIEMANVPVKPENTGFDVNVEPNVPVIRENTGFDINAEPNVPVKPENTGFDINAEPNVSVIRENTRFDINVEPNVPVIRENTGFDINAEPNVPVIPENTGFDINAEPNVPVKPENTGFDINAEPNVPVIPENTGLNINVEPNVPAIRGNTGFDINVDTNVPGILENPRFSIDVNIKRTYACDMCDYENVNDLELLTHLKTHFIPSTYKCDMCEFKCRKKRLLVSHIKKNHPESYQCLHCNHVYKKKRDLIKHMETYAHNKPRPHIVPDQRHELRSQDHLKTRSGEKVYSCDFCDKSFIEQSTHRRHMKLHGHKTYECTSCHLKFSYLHELRKHSTTHSPIRKKQTRPKVVRSKQESNSAAFPCRKCDKTFVSKALMREHIITHKGEKPHACLVCSKPFCYKLSLKKHLATHGIDA